MRDREKRDWLNHLTLAFAPSLILLTPVVSFLRHHDYALWTPEIGLVVLVVTAIGLVPGVLMALWAGLLGPVVLLVTIAVSYDLQNRQFDLVDFLITLGSDPVKSAICVLAVSAAATVIWLLRRRLGFIAICVSAVILLSTALLPSNSAAFGVKLDRLAAKRTLLPPVIHIVLDEHIGIAGLPADVPGGGALRDDLRRSYLQHGFRLFGGAFSHFSETWPSLAALLNGLDVPAPASMAPSKSGGSYLRANAWFAALGEAGYRIRIYQTDWLDYCIESHPQIEHCRSFAANSVKPLQDLDFSAWAKAKAILNSLAETSSLDAGLRNWTKMESLRISGFNALTMFEALGRDLKTEPRGTAYFLHAMLPHYSYVLDEDCTAIPDPRRWLNRISRAALGPGRSNSDESRSKRYRAYFRQLRCTQRLIERLVAELSQSELHQDATIVVHGDHGSRIALRPATEELAGQLTSQDIMDHYSTLFAVRAPGVQPGYDGAQRSVQALFAEYLLNRPFARERPEVILRRSEAPSSQPAQRLPMPRHEN